MDHPSSTQLMVGLPESGKTTFLAALWYFVRHCTGKNALRVDMLPAEREYLNQISDAWVQGKPQTHTSGTRIIDVTLKLHDPEKGLSSDLFIPDLSGELFIRHWADRQWTASFDHIARSLDGLLLFLHPNFVSPPVTIADVNAAAAAIRDPGAKAVEPSDKSAKEFDSSRVPIQAILVDQLQCFVGAPCFHRPLRVALVLSAWDEVKAEKKTPLSWCEQHAPFLYQFLFANKESLDVRIYGVSAQGGDYKNEEVRKKILLNPSPIDRIEVLAGDGAAEDITGPVRWIL